MRQAGLVTTLLGHVNFVAAAPKLFNQNPEAAPRREALRGIVRREQECELGWVGRRSVSGNGHSVPKASRGWVAAVTDQRATDSYINNLRARRLWLNACSDQDRWISPGLPLNVRRLA